MAERMLGLDVGTTAVRVVEVVLDRPGRVPVVSRVGEVPLPPGAVRDGEVVDPAAVGAAIEELWRQTGLRSRDVRVGLTGSRVVVRVVDLPAMPDAELAGAVRFSAADHIPIPLDEAVLDHAVLEPAPPAEPGGPPMVRVLVAAAHRSALDGLLAAVAAGGLRAVAVDLVPFALVTALAIRPRPSDPGLGDPADGSRDAPPVQAEAVVSVGAALTTVVVHEAGRPRFVRTVQVGGDMLTAAVAEELGLDLEAAETAKRDSRGAGEPGAETPVGGTPRIPGDDDLARRAARVVELRLSAILGEIQSGLAYWMAQSERPLRRIVLTGGGARAGDIAGRLALLVGAPVEWGAVQGLEAPEPAAGAGDWADLTVAAGLALGASAGSWRIDLCPPVKRSFRFTGEMGRRLAVAAVVVVLLLAGLSVRSVTALGRERARLAAQKTVNAKVEAEIGQFDSLRTLSTDLDAGRRRVQSALAGDVSWTRFLNDLVRSMPSGVWLQSLSVQTNRTAPAASTSSAASATSGSATSGSAASGSAGSGSSGAKDTSATTSTGSATGGTAAGIGSLQVTATALGFPAVADWLTKVGADPSLAGLAVGGLTSTAVGAQPTVAFTSTATLTSAARSNRAATLAKAAL